MTAEFPDAMTLGDARDRLREMAWDGARCPCCTQHVQVYRWSLYATAARTLVRLYQSGGVEHFVESKTVKTPGQGGDMTRLRHWGLVEHEPDKRPDGGKSGFWRVTPLGEAFLFDRVTISKYVWVYDGRKLREEGPRVGIRQALGKTFRYDEMMNGTMELAL